MVQTIQKRFILLFLPSKNLNENLKKIEFPTVKLAYCFKEKENKKIF